MNTLVWRLHRSQAYVTGAALIVLAAVLLITGIAVSGTYHDFVVGCAAAHDCGDPSPVLGRDGLITDWLLATMAIPLLFGMFWGAPLLATEFEDGTHGLAWTQGVTRGRWLSRTVAWPLLAALVWGGALAALVTWWRAPANALGFPGVRFDTGIFDIQGIMPVAYSVFAVALGIAMGTAFRRVLPAMATTLAVFTGVRFLITEFARPHYLTPASALVPIGGDNGPSGSWVLSNVTVGPGGQRYGNFTFQDEPAACRSLPPGPKEPACLAAHGFHVLITYQPAGRFWAFQGIEAAIFLVLAAALIAMTFRLVLARDA
ncbi:MAG TPA: hypothetical protein VMG38_01255 [Trebonia sp.]|nr:hypothetical protein [Trebonia sp.]